MKAAGPPSPPWTDGPAHLLDGNVLVALVSPSHVHHAAVEDWFAAQALPFATCPITQGTLLRLLMNLGPLDAHDAVSIQLQLTPHPRHRFWPDALGYGGMAWRGVIGHRQVTDAYLAGLARQFGGKLASLDSGLVALHADAAVLISEGGQP